MSTIAVNCVDLLAILLLAADQRTPETEATYARLWAAVRRQAPSTVLLHERVLDASEGAVSEYRRLAADGGEG